MATARTSRSTPTAHAIFESNSFINMEMRPTDELRNTEMPDQSVYTHPLNNIGSNRLRVNDQDNNATGDGLWSCVCAICLESFDVVVDPAVCAPVESRQPRILSCGHTFCAACIVSMIDHAKQSCESTVQCPTCRCNISLKQCVTDFPINYELVETLDAIQTQLDAVIQEHVVDPLPSAEKENLPSGLDDEVPDHPDVRKPRNAKTLAPECEDLGIVKCIYVKTTVGKRIELKDLPSSTPVRRVKELVELKHGVPVNAQHLLYGGKTLDNSRPIAHYGIGCTPFAPTIILGRRVHSG